MTWNGITMFSRDDINVRHTPVMVPVQTSMHGVIDQVRKDLVIRIPLRLWGAWENLATLFPATVLTPRIGTRIFGTTDVPLVLASNNGGSTGDTMTYHNAQLTRLANLYLGVDAPIFAADVEFTALIRNNTAPTNAAAYFTSAIGVAYSDATFVKTNFKQQVYSGVWGAVGGFTAIQAKLGWNIEWELGLEPEYVDGVGTVDMILTDFLGRARCIPIEATMAQITAASKLQDSGGGPGSLLSLSAADLVLTGTGVSVTLKNAGMTDHGMSWGMTPLRNGEVAWETTVAISSGTAAARAVIS
ncbi:MAG: hypothetical protein V2A79_08050 [Planctomycetota bacterium]